MREQEKELRDQLRRLMRKYPELPVVPIVNTEIADTTKGDFCFYWMGCWGYVELGAYIVGDDRIYLCDDDSATDGRVLNHTVGGKDWYDVPEDEAIEAYINLPWKKAIFVHIEIPWLKPD